MFLLRRWISVHDAVVSVVRISSAGVGILVGVGCVDSNDVYHPLVVDFCVVGVGLPPLVPVGVFGVGLLLPVLVSNVVLVLGGIVCYSPPAGA